MYGARSLTATADCTGASTDGAARSHDPISRRLMTVPGVGPVAALSFKVGVDDPLRFTRSRTAGAHFGLTPKRHQSGTSIDYEGRITKQGDVNVREALCEAAASLLLRVRKWSALRAWACGSPNGRVCCARSSRSRASSQVSCIECGSAKPTSTSAS